MIIVWQMEITFDLFATERNFQFFQRNRQKTSAIAVRHVGLNLCLFRQFIALKEGITGDGVITGSKKVFFAGCTLLSGLFCLFGFAIVFSGQLAPFVTPVTRNKPLYGIQLLRIGAFTIAGGNARQNFLHLNRLGPLPDPGSPAQNPEPRRST